jgi:hypothetical protein
MGIGSSAARAKNLPFTGGGAGHHLKTGTSKGL